MGKKHTSGVRRLLVISYHFPPDGSIGGQRWAGLTKYLARLGWEIHVVTASAPGTEQSTDIVRKHFRGRRKTFNDLYKASAGRLRVPRSNEAPPPGDAVRPTASRSFRPLAAVRRIVGSAMYLPDHGRGWVVRAAGAARAAMREREFDVVITSGPPHSSHYAGLLATRGSRAQFWIDMRDPWSITHEMHLPPDRFIRAERFVLRMLEKVVFRYATKVIANTQEFAAALREMEPEADVIWFPNGVDLDQVAPRNATAVQHGSIAHVGTLYANRSLSSVFAAMAAVQQNHGRNAAGLSLDVAGPLESPHRERMHDEIEAAGLASRVRVHGVIPRQKALELLSRSHLALVLAQDQPMCVPAKLYESVGLGIPTLVLAEETSAAAREARRIGAMAVDGEDVEGLRAIFEDLLAGRIPTTVVPKVPISYADTAADMDRLLRQAITP